MPIPFLLAAGAAVATGAGLVKGAKGVSNNSKAKDLTASAERKYNNAKNRLEEQRELTTENLESLGKIKLEAWSNDLEKFLGIHKTFKNISLERGVNTDENLKIDISQPIDYKKMEIACVKASEVLKAGVTSLGAGALAGVATYGGAMMFASASTGTAISTLTGIAKTNATLSWFGGGALSAGGLGISGGTAVLGGIVAGPVIAVAGFIMNAKSKENLAQAEQAYAEAKNAAEQMDIMTDAMKGISEISRNYEIFIVEFCKKYKPLLNEMEKVQKQAIEKQEKSLVNRIKKMLGMSIKVDFSKLDEKQQKVVHVSMLMAQVLYSVLTAPILNKDGNIDKNAEKVIGDAQNSVPKLETSINGLL